MIFMILLSLVILVNMVILKNLDCLVNLAILVIMWFYSYSGNSYEKEDYDEFCYSIKLCEFKKYGDSTYSC